MKAHHAAVLLLVLCAGCAQRSRITTYNTNYDEVWFGSLDAVSDRLQVDYADKKRGLIIARSDTRWVRTEARVEIIKRGPQYDVSVTAKDEKLRVLLKPSGLRTEQDREALCDNQQLPPVLLESIKKRVGKTPWARTGSDAVKQPEMKPDEKKAVEQKPAEKKPEGKPAEKKPGKEPAEKGPDKPASPPKAK